MELYWKKQSLIATCLYSGQIVCGYSGGWSAPIIPKLQDPKQTPLPEVLTDEQISWVGSVIFIGVITGPFAASYLSNAKGRKPSLLLGGCITIISLLVLVAPLNFAMLLVGRIIKGIGLGIINITSIVYLGEIASSNIRGIILAGTLISGCLGTLTAFSVVPFVSYRVSVYIPLIITAFYTIGVFFIPESPVYKILKEEDKEATEILVSLGRSNDIEDIMKTKTENEKMEKIQWLQVFTVKSNRKAIFITLTLVILQEMSGISAVVFFATTIFGLVASTIDPSISTIMIGLTQLCSSSITPFFIERAGRRILLLLSTGACSLTLAVLGTYFYLDANDHLIVSQLHWLPLAALITFFLSFNLGFGVIPNTLIGEMFEPNVRSIGTTMTITTGWIFGFIITSTFAYMINGLGSHVTFWIFSASCAVAFIFSAIFVPETKGKSLYEIQYMLSK